MIKANDFKIYWESQFPGAIPLAEHLKSVYKDRWCRIHTLPNAKRYAESEQEYKEILQRHNAILSDFFQDGETLIIVTISYSESQLPLPPDTAQTEIENQSTFLDSLAIHESDKDEPPFYRHLFIAEKRWAIHSLDTLLKSVADDQLRHVLFVSMEQPRIYHPYDGGADLILESESFRDEMKVKYRSWLSEHPSGL